MKWISVNDRLPEDTGDVLAWSPRYHEVVVAWYNEEEDFWRTEEDLAPFPSHWMPLPEPPKGGAIRTAPAADVVEVVRCKDCKYWKCYGGQYADDGECWHLGELDCCMHKDDYCSKGRRKMDKEE